MLQKFREMSDVKRFLVEDMAVYACMFFASILWDYIANIMHVSPEGHPVSFGVFQVGLLAFSVMQIVRTSVKLWFYDK